MHRILHRPQDLHTTKQLIEEVVEFRRYKNSPVETKIPKGMNP